MTRLLLSELCVTSFFFWDRLNKKQKVLEEFYCAKDISETQTNFHAAA